MLIGRAAQLAKRHRTGYIFAAGRIESRIGQQSHRAEFQQRGRAANVREDEIRRLHHVNGFVRSPAGFRTGYETFLRP